MNAYAILAGGALAILAIAEILVSRQKAQMKKQFLEELAGKTPKSWETANNHGQPNQKMMTLNS